MFDSLVGNERAKETLRRMLRQGRVPGALLFGPVMGSGGLLAIFLVLAWFAWVMGFTYGPLGGWLSALFPVRVRYTAIGLAFTIGGIVGGALTPIAATAMAAEGNIGALVAGGIAGLSVLAAIAVAMLRYSRKLPIGKFFGYSSALVAILAVVLAGKGMAALQEAGLVGVHPLAALPRISMLGLLPTLQTVFVQVLTAVALMLGFAWNRRQGALTVRPSA
jgi:hypothetical protein